MHFPDLRGRANVAQKNDRKSAREAWYSIGKQWHSKNHKFK